MSRDVMQPLTHDILGGYLLLDDLGDGVGAA